MNDGILRVNKIDDNDILDLLFSRNEDGLKFIKSKHGRCIYCISNNILECSEDAEECVNDLLGEAWRLIPPNRKNTHQLKRQYRLYEYSAKR